ncbi:MAG TPA: hypothetical protein VM204_01705, partial [Gaiellaceae bacterium]|nr:hypothetical protein [Gaiellaceae bacterium]
MKKELEMNAEAHPRRWWALGLLSVAQFLVILDTSIIGIAQQVREPPAEKQQAPEGDHVRVE